jgi:hypothetical protein
MKTRTNLSVATGPSNQMELDCPFTTSGGVVDSQQFQFRGESPGPVGLETTALDVFKRFFTREIIDLIVNCSNKYAQSSRTKKSDKMKIPVRRILQIVIFGNGFLCIF